MTGTCPDKQKGHDRPTSGDHGLPGASYSRFRSENLPASEESSPALTISFPSFDRTAASGDLSGTAASCDAFPLLSTLAAERAKSSGKPMQNRIEA